LWTVIKQGVPARYYDNMKSIEKSARAQRRWGSFQKSLLVAIGAAGLVLVAAAAPNTLQLLKYLPGMKDGARFRYQSKTVLGRLAEKGYVKFEERNGKRYARITDRGQLELAKTRPTVRRRWDTRWRVVLFDVPEKRKAVRDRLRRFMDLYGFVRLQDSVWIYPYDCEEIIALAKADFRIGHDVLYMIVERLENDKHLREHFKLPSE
jgi:predicted transcriptional regulator